MTHGVFAGTDEQRKRTNMPKRIFQKHGACLLRCPVNSLYQVSSLHAMAVEATARAMQSSIRGDNSPTWAMMFRQKTTKTALRYNRTARCFIEGTALAWCECPLEQPCAATALVVEVSEDIRPAKGYSIIVLSATRLPAICSL